MRRELRQYNATEKQKNKHKNPRRWEVTYATNQRANPGARKGHLPEWPGAFSLLTTEAQHVGSSCSHAISLLGLYISHFFFNTVFFLAAPDLSYSIREIVPWPGTEPGPPALEVQSLSHWATREVPPLTGPFFFCSLLPSFMLSGSFLKHC